MNYEERTSEAIRKIKAELLEQDLIDPNEGLTGLEIKQRKHLEKIVSKSLSASVAAAKALRVIHNHRDGAMWRKHHDSFQDYCRAKWGYQKAHAYRLLEAGEFIVDLEVARGRESDSQSPFGDSPAGGLWVAKTNRGSE